MADTFFLLVFLSVLVERVSEKLLYLLPGKRRVWAWVVSTILALLITFLFRVGLLGMMGFAASSGTASRLDYVITALLIASGSEPIHVLFRTLEYKKEEIRGKAKAAKDA